MKVRDRWAVCGANGIYTLDFIILSIVLPSINGKGTLSQ